MSKRGKIEILADFMQGLNRAIDASGQMASCHRLNPKWLAMRDMLNLIKDDMGRMCKGMTRG